MSKIKRLCEHRGVNYDSWLKDHLKSTSCQIISSVHDKLNFGKHKNVSVRTMLTDHIYYLKWAVERNVIAFTSESLWNEFLSELEKRKCASRL